MALLDIVVCDTATFGLLFDLLVCRVGVLGDYVPGVDETGEEAQAAESDVDQRVGRAETALDPYCKLLAADISRFVVFLFGPCCTGGCAGRVENGGIRSGLTSERREKDGQEAQEDIAAAHVVRLIVRYLFDVMNGVCARG
jgi:hypothetical protein